jgi:hypothetical protein
MPWFLLWFLPWFLLVPVIDAPLAAPLASDTVSAHIATSQPLTPPYDMGVASLKLEMGFEKRSSCIGYELLSNRLRKEHSI